MHRAQLSPGAGAPHGFTLVELLIAISLLGLISVVTYSAIWTASLSLRTVGERVERNDEQRVTQELLRQTLSQARAVLTTHEGLMQVLFTGEQHTLSFVSLAPLQRGSAGGLYYYRCTLHDGGDGRHTLQLAYWQFLAGVELDVTQAPLGQSLLLEEVARFSLSYYGRAEPGGEGRWMDEWPRTDTLPQLVRVEVQQSGEEAGSSMTVAIKGQQG